MRRKRTFHLAVVRLWVGAALANSLFTARICAVPGPLSARRLGAGRDHKVRACRRLKSERTRFKPLPLPAKGRAWLCHKGVYRDRAKEWKRGVGGQYFVAFCVLHSRLVGQTNAVGTKHKSHNHLIVNKLKH